MKARRVKALDPQAPLEQNALRIIAVRLDEMLSFGPRALDPSAVEELHDMRIAAKRLRYILELTAPVLGQSARYGAKQAKGLQDLLGEIHDCDETLPLLERHLERLRSEDAAWVGEHAEAGANDLDPVLVRDAPHRRSYRGVESLHTYFRARRRLLYARFVGEWSRLERERFGERLMSGLEAERR
ncbi:MAG: hypothetical protein NVSMB25_03760 [Thermoleophilaceae bacterium]